MGMAWSATRAPMHTAEVDRQDVRERRSSQTLADHTRGRSTRTTSCPASRSRRGGGPRHSHHRRRLVLRAKRLMEFLRPQVRIVMSAVWKANPETIDPGAESAEGRSTAGARGRDALNAEQTSTTQCVAKFASDVAAMLETAVLQSTLAGRGRQKMPMSAKKSLSRR